jgi:ElaB/YqjD/DUF883 family membrane-anchored ribosome-binding protein
MNNRYEETLTAGAKDLGDSARAAGHRVDGVMESASDMLEQGKDGLRERVRDAGDSLNRAGRGVAKVMSDSADYIRGSDARDMMSDVRALSQKHPGASMVTFAVIGFLIGRSLRKSD